jgi:hypothetical protein
VQRDAAHKPILQVGGYRQLPAEVSNAAAER